MLKILETKIYKMYSQEISEQDRASETRLDEHAPIEGTVQMSSTYIFL